MTAAAATELELPGLSLPQLEIIEARERCVDAEGAIRSGKSTAAGLKAWMRCLSEQGVNGLASRWKQQDVDGQLRALWRQVGAWFPTSLHPTWDAQEECYIFQDPECTAREHRECRGKHSRLYMRSLKASEETGRYSKFRGLTLAFVWLEQAEEIPQDVYVELKGRLSQPSYYKQILLTPNPVDEDHWIAEEFPTEGTQKPNHRYITSDVYSNRDILGDEVIAGFEEDYPEGHPKRRTLIQGLRGVNVIGRPVYEGYFSMSLVQPVAFDDAFELLEGWDFGHAYPAVVWAQYFPAVDRLHLLGAVQGRDMFLEEFQPEVEAIRTEWFPHALRLSWCDPSGETGNQGTKATAMSTLWELGESVRAAEHGNDPVARDRAIQTVSALMFRRRFRVSPNCLELVRVGRSIERRPSKVLVSALSNGYVWDERKNPRANPNIRSPKKGTRYDHTMNCLEYIVTGSRIPAKPRPEDVKRAAAQHRPAVQRVAQQQIRNEQAALRKSQQDFDPDERPVRRWRGASGGFAGRGGY